MTAPTAPSPYGPALRFGLLLGAVLSVLMLVEGFTGWYRDFVMIRMRMLSPVALLVIVAATVWHLRVHRWRGRLLGALAAVGVAAVLYAFSTYVVAGVLFPDYAQTMQEHHRQGLMAQGKTQAEIAATLAAHQRTLGREVFDAGTLVAEGGVVASLLFATVIRQKKAE